MKKSIKRLLVMTQVLGLSALVATACTKNTAETKPTEKTTSTSTTANKETESGTKNTTDKDQADATKTPSENKADSSVQTELKNLTTTPEPLNKEQQDVVQNDLKNVFNDADLTTLSQKATLDKTHDDVKLQKANEIPPLMNDKDASEIKQANDKVFTDKVLQEIVSGKKTQNPNIVQANPLTPTHP